MCIRLGLARRAEILRTVITCKLKIAGILLKLHKVELLGIYSILLWPLFLLNEFYTLYVLRI